MVRRTIDFILHVLQNEIIDDLKKECRGSAAMKNLMVSVPRTAVRDPWDSICLSEVIETIGFESFADRMLAGLAQAFDARHCAFFQMRDRELTQIGAAAVLGAEMPPKSELTPYEIKRQLSQLRSSEAQVDIHSVAAVGASREGSGRLQRVMISARKSNLLYCLRFLRSASDGNLSESKVERLRSVADLLISLIARHDGLLARRPNLTPALTSLEEIQDCVLGATDLSRREGEVCSRILYGLSSYGIALDLGIGKESVMTYRKRAYHRLGIGSQRELLMWYLALWTALRGRDGMQASGETHVGAPLGASYRRAAAATSLTTA
jgi:DNA-binding CsgD family transcriptional regulator